ncbi:hypothetical protein Tco_0934227 [Tanacetum coccineum]
MEREVTNDNQKARKLLDVVKDLDKSLKRRQRIIDELKVKKSMRAWKAINFFRKVEHREMEMRQQLMMHNNETQMRTFKKSKFVEAMKKPLKGDDVVILFIDYFDYLEFVVRITQLDIWDI